MNSIIKVGASVSESHKWSFAFNFHTLAHAVLGGDHTKVHEERKESPSGQPRSVPVSH